MKKMGERCVYCEMPWPKANELRASQEVVAIHPACLKSLEMKVDTAYHYVNALANMANGIYSKVHAISKEDFQKAKK